MVLASEFDDITDDARLDDDDVMMVGGVMSEGSLEPLPNPSRLSEDNFLMTRLDRCGVGETELARPKGYW